MVEITKKPEMATMQKSRKPPSLLQGRAGRAFRRIATSALLASGIILSQGNETKAQQLQTETISASKHTDMEKPAFSESVYANQAGIANKFSLDYGKSRLSIAATYFSYYQVTAPSVSYVRLFSPAERLNFRLGTSYAWFSQEQMSNHANAGAFYTINKGWGGIGFGTVIAGGIEYSVPVQKQQWSYAQISAGSALRVRNMSVILSSDFALTTPKPAIVDKWMGNPVLPLSVSLGANWHPGKFATGLKGTLGKLKSSISAYAGYGLPKGFWAGVQGQVDSVYSYAAPTTLVTVGLAWKGQIAKRNVSTSAVVESSTSQLPTATPSSYTYSDVGLTSNALQNSQLAEGISDSLTLRDFAGKYSLASSDEKLRVIGLFSYKLYQYMYGQSQDINVNQMYDTIRSAMGENKPIPIIDCTGISLASSELARFLGYQSSIMTMPRPTLMHIVTYVFQPGVATIIDQGNVISVKGGIEEAVRVYSDIEYKYAYDPMKQKYVRMMLDFWNVDEYKGRLWLKEGDLFMHQVDGSSQRILEDMLLLK